MQNDYEIAQVLNLQETHASKSGTFSKQIKMLLFYFAKIYLFLNTSMKIKGVYKYNFRNTIL